MTSIAAILMIAALTQSQEKKGEELLEALEKKIAAAKTIEIAVKVEVKNVKGDQSESYRATGMILLADGNKAFVDTWPDNHSGGVNARRPCPMAAILPGSLAGTLRNSQPQRN